MVNLLHMTGSEFPEQCLFVEIGRLWFVVGKVCKI